MRHRIVSSIHRRFALAAVACLTALGLGAAAHAQAFELAPAVAVEAEDFTVEQGWAPIRNGEGNYNVDIIGFGHIGGERLLQAGKNSTDAVAHMDVQVPEAGTYRLWVRYEYPAFTEARFEVSVEQNGQTLATKVMGARDNPRLEFNSNKLQPQYDPSWGPEGLAMEPLDVADLKQGQARITLRTVEQPDIPGVTANRNIDFIYMTTNLEDSWFQGMGGAGQLYPILNAFRDTVGPRWEARLHNKGDQAANFSIAHNYNRIPWGATEPGPTDVAAGQASDWWPLTMQDTTHFAMITFTSNAGPFSVELRPVGGGDVARTVDSYGGWLGVYVPPYAHWDQTPITPVEQIERTLALLESTPAPASGVEPTKPLAYGGWLPLFPSGDQSQTPYHEAYQALYKAIGMRNFPSSPRLSPEQMKAMGLEPTRSLAIMGYRNPPTAENVAKAKEDVEKNNLQDYVKWYDYGDEIHFSEWVGMLVEGVEGGIPALWTQWLDEHRPDWKAEDYWLEEWGAVNKDEVRPDSSAKAAQANPRLYVDSVIFYEQSAIEFVAEGKDRVKEALGEHVLAGANYSAHPFYYPTTPMYVHWFRDGAADMGRHSEYFWQVAQAGPMVNGYLVELFRAGIRFNPEAVIRQYTMPHAPGNTDASFLRTGFTHLAHGAQMLDYFGIGMNETFTENHIDHRAHGRYAAIRDLNHSMALVEDVMLESQVVPSTVGILVSEATERWDLAGIATDRAGHSWFGPDFRTTRLHYHQDRVGMWKALTFLGASPDLLVEPDLSNGVLDAYKVLFLAGDSLPLEKTADLEKWVNAGGVLVATAGAGKYGTYREANPDLQRLLGIAGREIEERHTFLRPLQELQFLEPISTIEGEGWSMPALATHERIEPVGGADVLATFDDGQPAVIAHQIGKGRVVYVAALPGLSYFWSGLQPPRVPDRGVNTHTVPDGFDEGIAAFFQNVLAMAGVEPTLLTDPGQIDGRLVRGEGVYFLPLANYNREVGQAVTVSLKIDGTPKRVISAYHGNLGGEMADGRLQFTVPELGYGDLIRIEME